MQKFLIVDDHPMFREAMQSALRSAYPKAEVHEATGIDGAADMLSGLRRSYDLALLDLSMPGTTGFDGLLRLRNQFPRLPILIVSALDDPRVVREALSYGISGFVSKSAKKAEIVRAVATVLAGGVHVPEGHQRNPPPPATHGTSDLVTRLSTLTPQQMRVLQMLRQGMLNKQIAHELDVGETTVKAHVSEILRKLDVVSRTQAVIEVSRIDFDQFTDADRVIPDPLHPSRR